MIPILVYYIMKYMYNEKDEKKEVVSVKRILMMVIRNIFLVPYMWIKLNYYARHVDKYTEEERYKLLKFIDHRANISGNIEIRSSGVENIPAEGGCVFFPNHQGLYDVLAIMEVCPYPFSVVMKKELSNIPFLKQVFALMKAMELDRDDTKQALKVIINVTKEVKNGRKYLIFAEGTRSKNGNVPGEFKGGSFKCATKAKAPIVPVALIDCFVPFDVSSVKHTTVQVHFLEPILYEEYKDMKTTELAEEVKKRIEKAIEQNK
jgi:1-acyl-sn-glycerol-3-phosphate acyltransferase